MESLADQCALVKYCIYYFIVDRLYKCNDI